MRRKFIALKSKSDSPSGINVKRLIHQINVRPWQRGFIWQLTKPQSPPHLSGILRFLGWGEVEHSYSSRTDISHK